MSSLFIGYEKTLANNSARIIGVVESDSMQWIKSVNIGKAVSTKLNSIVVHKEIKESGRKGAKVEPTSTPDSSGNNKSMIPKSFGRPKNPTLKSLEFILIKPFKHGAGLSVPALPIPIYYDTDLNEYNPFKEPFLRPVREADAKNILITRYLHKTIPPESRSDLAIYPGEPYLETKDGWWFKLEKGQTLWDAIKMLAAEQMTTAHIIPPMHTIWVVIQSLNRMNRLDMKLIGNLKYYLEQLKADPFTPGGTGGITNYAVDSVAVLRILVLLNAIVLSISYPEYETIIHGVTIWIFQNPTTNITTFKKILKGHLLNPGVTSLVGEIPVYRGEPHADTFYTGHESRPFSYKDLTQERIIKERNRPLLLEADEHMLEIRDATQRDAVALLMKRIDGIPGQEVMDVAKAMFVARTMLNLSGYGRQYTTLAHVRNAHYPVPDGADVTKPPPMAKYIQKHFREATKLALDTNMLAGAHDLNLRTVRGTTTKSADMSFPFEVELEDHRGRKIDFSGKLKDKAGILVAMGFKPTLDAVARPVSSFEEPEMGGKREVPGNKDTRMIYNVKYGMASIGRLFLNILERYQYAQPQFFNSRLDVHLWQHLPAIIATSNNGYLGILSDATAFDVHCHKWNVFDHMLIGTIEATPFTIDYGEYGTFQSLAENYMSREGSRVNAWYQSGRKPVPLRFKELTRYEDFEEREDIASNLGVMVERLDIEYSGLATTLNDNNATNEAMTEARDDLIEHDDPDIHKSLSKEYESIQGDDLESIFKLINMLNAEQIERLGVTISRNAAQNGHDINATKSNISTMIIEYLKVTHWCGIEIYAMAIQPFCAEKPSEGNNIEQMVGYSQKLRQMVERGISPEFVNWICLYTASIARGMRAKDANFNTVVLYPPMEIYSVPKQLGGMGISPLSLMISDDYINAMALYYDEPSRLRANFCIIMLKETSTDMLEKMISAFIDGTHTTPAQIAKPGIQAINTLLFRTRINDSRAAANRLRLRGIHLDSRDLYQNQPIKLVKGMIESSSASVEVKRMDNDRTNDLRVRKSMELSADTYLNEIPDVLLSYGGFMFGNKLEDLGAIPPLHTMTTFELTSDRVMQIFMKTMRTVGVSGSSRTPLVRLYRQILKDPGMLVKPTMETLEEMFIDDIKNILDPNIASDKLVAIGVGRQYVAGAIASIITDLINAGVASRNHWFSTTQIMSNLDVSQYTIQNFVETTILIHPTLALVLQNFALSLNMALMYCDEGKDHKYLHKLRVTPTKQSFTNFMAGFAGNDAITKLQPLGPILALLDD